MGKETYYRFTLRRSHYFMCVYLNMLHIEVNTLCTIWLRHFTRLRDAKEGNVFVYTNYYIYFFIIILSI